MIIRRIRLNSCILLNKKNRRKFNLLGNRRVCLFRRNVKVQAQFAKILVQPMNEENIVMEH